MNELIIKGTLHPNNNIINIIAVHFSRFWSGGRKQQGIDTGRICEHAKLHTQSNLRSRLHK